MLSTYQTTSSVKCKSSKIAYFVKLVPLVALVVMATKIDLHAYQGKAILSDKRIVAAVSGIQGGKTMIGALWSRKCVSDPKSKSQGRDSCGIVCVPTYKTWTQATSYHFNRILGPLGKHNQQANTFTLHDGRIIYIRSLDNPWAIEGITNCDWIWGDEAGLFSYQAWVNIQGRAAFRQAQIFLTTTPYSLNWLYTELYKGWRDGKRDDVDIVQWRSIDNPHFPKAEFERQQKLLDPRVFEMKYCGHFSKMAGLVYADFDQDANMETPGPLDPRWYHMCAGVDFGYRDPFALAVRAIHLKEPRDYQIAEIHKQHLTPTQVADECIQAHKRFGVKVYYCDGARPDLIAELNTRFALEGIGGVSAQAVPKGKDSIALGVNLHRGLIRTREYKVFRGRCPQTLDEYETYHYPEDVGDEEALGEVPVDAHNHLMDANRYATSGTEWLRQQRAKAGQFVPARTYLEEMLTEAAEAGDWYNG